MLQTPNFRTFLLPNLVPALRGSLLSEARPAGNILCSVPSIMPHVPVQIYIPVGLVTAIQQKHATPHMNAVGIIRFTGPTLSASLLGNKRPIILTPLTIISKLSESLYDMDG